VLMQTLAINFGKTDINYFQNLLREFALTLS